MVAKMGLVRRMKAFVVLVLAFSLAANMTLSEASAARGRHKASFSRNESRNARALQWFQANDIIDALLQEAAGKGESLKLDTPAFIDVETESGDKALTVTIGGHRGKNQVALITGYFHPESGSLAMAQALYFHKQGKEIRIESTIHAQGQTKRNGGTYDPSTGQLHTDGGRQTGGREEAALSFGQAASATYTCQKTECSMTYTLLSFLSCALVTLLTAGFGGFICALVTLNVPAYVCETIYEDCP